MTSFMFDANELKAHGVDAADIDITGFELLSNDIHPIFRRDLWLSVDADQLLFEKLKSWALSQMGEENRRAHKLLSAMEYADQNSYFHLQNCLEYKSIPSATKLAVPIPPDISDWKNAGIVLTREECQRYQMGEAEYGPLRPMLRLATRLLKLCLPSLWKVYHGKHTEAKGGPDGTEDVWILAEAREPTEHQLNHFDRLLSSMLADHLIFFLDSAACQRRNVLASTHNVHMRAANGAGEGWVSIGLDRETIQARLPPSPAHPALDVLTCRSAFAPATWILHELAHAMHMMNPNTLAELVLMHQGDVPSENGIGNTSEPYFDVADARIMQKPELGRALEAYLLGGTLGRCEVRESRSGAGHSFAPLLGERAYGSSGYERRDIGVDEKSILAFFRQDVWEKRNQEPSSASVPPLRIDLTPCRARDYGLSLVTQDFDDKLDEYAAEAVAETVEVAEVYYAEQVKLGQAKRKSKRKVWPKRKPKKKKKWLMDDGYLRSTG